MAEAVVILLPMNAETGWNTQNSQTIHMYMLMFQEKRPLI